jgi:hypothetical protein
MLLFLLKNIDLREAVINKFSLFLRENNKNKDRKWQYKKFQTLLN